MLPIYSYPGHLIRRAHQMSTSVFSERMLEAGEDLTPVQYGSLVGIEAHPGLDQGTLAGLIAYDRVTIGGVLDRLEAKGLIERRVSPSDRRARVLQLTAKGTELLARITPVVEAIQPDILANLDEPERAELLRLLTKAVAARPG